MAYSNGVIYLTRPDLSDDPYRVRLRRICTPTHMRWPLQANEIIDRLFIADMYTATSARALKDLGITHVVSTHCDENKVPADVVGHLHLRVNDVAQEDILQHLDASTEFIRAALASSPTARVLVHCVWGMSRSVAFVIAYLVASRDLFYHEALEIVSQRRSLARPNSGFTHQLVLYANAQGVPARRALESMKKLKWNRPSDPPTEPQRAPSSNTTSDDDDERMSMVRDPMATILESTSLLRVVDTVTCS